MTSSVTHLHTYMHCTSTITVHEQFVLGVYIFLAYSTCILYIKTIIFVGESFLVRTNPCHPNQRVERSRFSISGMSNMLWTTVHHSPAILLVPKYIAYPIALIRWNQETQAEKCIFWHSWNDTTWIFEELYFVVHLQTVGSPVRKENATPTVYLRRFLHRGTDM